MKKITQKKAVFYMLYQAYKNNPEEYVPIWKFVGELYIEELATWFFMSYKTPTNGPVILFENPDLVERRYTTGKSGSKFYEYRLKENPTRMKICDTDLRAFYDSIKVGNHGTA